MSIQKRKRKILTMARALCADVEIERAGRHLCVRFTGPEGSRKVFCSLTPSDHRDMKNMRGDFVRAARAVRASPPPTLH